MLGLRTAIYKVNEIEKAKEWYTKAFEVHCFYKERQGLEIDHFLTTF